MKFPNSKAMYAELCNIRQDLTSIKLAYKLPANAYTDITLIQDRIKELMSKVSL